MCHVPRPIPVYVILRYDYRTAFAVLKRVKEVSSGVSLLSDDSTYFTVIYSHWRENLAAVLVIAVLYYAAFSLWLPVLTAPNRSADNIE